MDLQNRVPSKRHSSNSLKVQDIERTTEIAQPKIVNQETWVDWQVEITKQNAEGRCRWPEVEVIQEGYLLSVSLESVEELERKEFGCLDATVLWEVEL